MIQFLHNSKVSVFIIYLYYTTNSFIKTRIQACVSIRKLWHWLLLSNYILKIRIKRFYFWMNPNIQQLETDHRIKWYRPFDKWTLKFIP